MFKEIVVFIRLDQMQGGKPESRIEIYFRSIILQKEMAQRPQLSFIVPLLALQRLVVLLLMTTTTTTIMGETRTKL
jgi:hypothetical protein